MPMGSGIEKMVIGRGSYRQVGQSLDIVEVGVVVAVVAVAVDC